MGLITKFFGQEGKVRFEFETMDGQTLSAKISVEMFNIGEDELKQDKIKLKDMNNGEDFLITVSESIQKIKVI